MLVAIVVSFKFFFSLDQSVITVIVIKRRMKLKFSFITQMRWTKKKSATIMICVKSDNYHDDLMKITDKKKPNENRNVFRFQLIAYSTLVHRYILQYLTNALWKQFQRKKNNNQHIIDSYLAVVSSYNNSKLLDILVISVRSFTSYFPMLDYIIYIISLFLCVEMHNKNY